MNKVPMKISKVLQELEEGRAVTATTPNGVISLERDIKRVCAMIGAGCTFKIKSEFYEELGKIYTDESLTVEEKTRLVQIMLSKSKMLEPVPPKAPTPPATRVLTSEGWE